MKKVLYLGFALCYGVPASAGECDFSRLSGLFRPPPEDWIYDGTRTTPYEDSFPFLPKVAVPNKTPAFPSVLPHHVDSELFQQLLQYRENHPELFQLAQEKRSSTFGEYFQERKRRGLTNHVVDLFGSGLFADASSADSMTGIRIEELPTPNPPNREQIVGNAFRRKTFDQLVKRLNSLEAPFVDVFVFRPVGGLTFDGETTAQRQGLLLTALNRYYEVLNPHHGEMFLQIPNNEFPAPLMERWVKS